MTVLPFEKPPESPRTADQLDDKEVYNHYFKCQPSGHAEQNERIDATSYSGPSLEIGEIVRARTGVVRGHVSVSKLDIFGQHVDSFTVAATELQRLETPPVFERNIDAARILKPAEILMIKGLG